MSKPTNRIVDDWTPAEFRALDLKLARERLELLHDEIKRTGSGLDVLRAVSVCAMRDIVMPYWLSVEFLKRYRDATHARVAGWDEAFGRPWPKGVHLSTRRRARKYAPLVFKAVTALHSQGKAISKELFADVAADLHLKNATLVEDLYYEEKRLRESHKKLARRPSP